MATKNHEIIKIRNGIARQLREARISAHLSLTQVEKLSGIPANIIDLLEVGIKPVDLGHLHQLAKAYGIILLITFAELSIGLWALRVERFWKIAAIIALLDLLPLVGSGAVLVPWGIYCLCGRRAAWARDC